MQHRTVVNSTNSGNLQAKNQRDYAQQCIDKAREMGVMPFTGLQFANRLIDILNLILKSEPRNIAFNTYKRKDEVRALAKLVYNHFCDKSHDDQMIFKDENLATITTSKPDKIAHESVMEVPPLKAIWPSHYQLPVGDDQNPTPVVAAKPFAPIEPLIKQIRLITAKSIKTYFSYAPKSTIAAEIDELCDHYTTINNQTQYDIFAACEPDLLLSLAKESSKPEVAESTQDSEIEQLIKVLQALPVALNEEDTCPPIPTVKAEEKLGVWGQVRGNTFQFFQEAQKTVGVILDGLDKAFQRRGQKMPQPTMTKSSHVDVPEISSSQDCLL